MNGAGTNLSSNAALTVIVPPLITAQPQSQTIRIGSNATFSATASGTDILTYQWRFNTTNIPGATGTNYTRFNAQTNDAGNYSVVVSNLAGFATSSNAALVVHVPVPSHIESITLLPDNRLRLIATGELGSYALQLSSNLTNWADQASVTNTNGTFQFLIDPPHPDQSFYKVRLLP